MSNRIAIVVLIVLVLGVILTVFLTRQVTQTKQEASTKANINKGKSLAPAKNSDGTMGPSNYSGNYSGTLPKSQLGILTVLITDPDLTKAAFPTRIPTVTPSGKTSLIPSKPTLDKTNKFKSLIIQIKKAEVHNDSKDKWETLKLDFPMSMDLIQLQNGNTATLSGTQLAEGKYSEIRLYISSSSTVLQGDKVENLNISDKDRIVRIEHEFNVNRNRNTTLTVDFDAQASIIFEQNKYYLKPVVLRFLAK